MNDEDIKARIKSMSFAERVALEIVMDVYRNGTSKITPQDALGMLRLAKLDSDGAFLAMGFKSIRRQFREDED